MQGGRVAQFGHGGAPRPDWGKDIDMFTCIYIIYIYVYARRRSFAIWRWRRARTGLG